MNAQELKKIIANGEGLNVEFKRCENGLSNLTPSPKNPLLARFFVNIGFADTLGSGVRNLYKYTKAYSGIEPQLIEGDIFKIIVPLHAAFTASATNPILEKKFSNENSEAPQPAAEILRVKQEIPRVKEPSSEETPRVKQEVPREKEPPSAEMPRVKQEIPRVKVDTRGTETGEKILTLLLENPAMSTPEISKIIGISHKGVEWQLNNLKTANLLRHIGPNRSGHWEVLKRN